MEISRDRYVQQMINKKHNGLIKVITGIRRCGKSYLMDPLFKRHLIAEGVPKDHIIKIELDRPEYMKYHNDPIAFDHFVREYIRDDMQYYLLLDEIQLVKNFEYVLNGFLYDRNLDVYVTGSNSKFLSTDIITEFIGRADQIHLFPLSFSEFYPTVSCDKYDAWREYLTFGGMPLAVEKKTDEEKAAYLKDLFEQTYFTDIVNRNRIKRRDLLDAIVDILASSIGALTNTQKVYDTFKSHGEKELSLNTVNSYITCLEDAFVVKKAFRYDVKGRKYIGTPQKYYFTDLGLRNARLNFRQQEETRLTENAIFNELLYRGYNVDIGVVEIRENGKRLQKEVDFICNKGNNRFYIQSALHLDTREKTIQESRSLNHIKDSFKKIIIVGDNIKPWWTDDGILVMGILDFLLDQESLMH
ncbi:MAG: ATP-binding protein [Clostridia bacterium]|nr:ATP-binding protein [Clostridia bacterium]